MSQVKKLLFAVVTAVALCLGACGDPLAPASGVADDRHMPSQPYGIKVDSAYGSRYYSKIGVWTDPKTGCEYFTGEVSGGIFMTPRVSKGWAVCHDEKSTDYQMYLQLKQQFEDKRSPE